MSRWTFLAALLMSMALPLGAQTSKSTHLPDVHRVCKAALADGAPYEVWDRVLETEWEGQRLYVKVRAYDSEHGYTSYLKDRPKKAGASCEEPHGHILILQDGNRSATKLRLKFDPRLPAAI